MEWLFTLAPIGLVLLVCVGLHAFMMRGMHGQAGHGGAHDMHGDQPATGAGEAERLRQLESEVTSLREQVAAVGKGSNGTGSAAVDGADRSLVAGDPTRRRSQS